MREKPKISPSEKGKILEIANHFVKAMKGEINETFFPKGHNLTSIKGMKMNKNTTRNALKNPVQKAIKAQVAAAKAKEGPKASKPKAAAKKAYAKPVCKVIGHAWGDIKLPRPLKHSHTPEWYTAHKFDSQWYECALDALDALIESKAFKLAAVASRETMKELIAHLKEQEKAERKAKAKK